MDNELKILCPFCDAVYTSTMIEELNYTVEGCDTCGYGSETHTVIEVECSNCGRVVYRKENTL